MHTTALPQLERLFIADAGLETDIIFNHGVDLPSFASITLLQTEEGKRLLRDYFQGFIDLAARSGTGCLLETASWRASPDWAEKLGLGQEKLDGLNTASVQMLRELRDSSPTADRRC
jgi:S-methylmethionine-dependent homocysteine/selenocysteine methylase